MKLAIMDFNSIKQEVIIPDDVLSIAVHVISGDESLHFVMPDGTRAVVEHETAKKCNHAFYDGSYCIYNKIANINLIERWNKRYDSYEFMEELWDEEHRKEN